MFAAGAGGAWHWPGALTEVRVAALWVFVVALVIRLLALGVATHDPAATADSAIYIGIGHGVAETGEFVRKYVDHYEPVTERVPLYPAFLAIFFTFFGDNLTFPLLIQCVLDAVTCILVGLIARELRPELFVLAGGLAACNLNMAVHATLILTDTLFLFLFTASLLGLVKYAVRPSWGPIFVAGAALGLAILTRPLAYYFWPVLIVFAAAVPVVHGVSFRKTVLLAGVGALTVGLIVGPLLARNLLVYGYPQLVSQGGAGALEWYVPLAFQYATGENTDTVIRREQVEVERILAQEPDIERRDNPFFVSKVQVEVAARELDRLNAFQIAYAWAGGALLNLFTPSLSSWPVLVEMKRPRFFETPGRNFADKAMNFLFHPDNRLYVFTVIPAIAFTLVSRLACAVGLACGLFGKRIPRLAVWVILSAAGFVLVITGPLVSAARYRLPLEPVLIVFLALGVFSLYQYWRKRLRPSA